MGSSACNNAFVLQQSRCHYTSGLELLVAFDLIARSTVKVAVMTTPQKAYDIAEHQPDHSEDYAVIDQHIESTVARVQPTDNPYHWEIPKDDCSNISSWVKTSWSCTNEKLRTRAAGTLKRNAAVRWTGKRHALNTGIKSSTVQHDVSQSKFGIHRSFNFEKGELCSQLGVVLEERAREQVASESVVRVDSGAGQGAEE